MAVGLQISVFENAEEVLFGEPIQEEVVAIGAGSLTSNPISGSTTAPVPVRRVRFVADADCFVHWGDNPTALTDGSAGRMLGAENPEVFGIPAGKVIAVINRV